MLEGIVSLGKLSYDLLSVFSLCFSIHVPPFRLEINPINYNSSLHFSIVGTGYYEYDFGETPDAISEERLTLAYF